MFSLLNVFRIFALLEGLSYLLLLFIAMPIKYLEYFGEDPQYVKLLGMPHGLLFVGYVILAIILGSKLKWEGKTLLFILAASVIPFGTFYVDKTYLKRVS